MRRPPFVDFIVPNGTLVRRNLPDSQWDFIFGVRGNLRRFMRVFLYAFSPLYPFYGGRCIFIVPTETVRREGDLFYINEAIDIVVKLHTMMGIMTTIKPISDRVFLEPMEEDRITKSGIVLPDSAEKERPMKGRVLAVGIGKLNDNGGRNPMSVKVGDVVLFKKYGPDEIELEGKKYLVAEESDILAILES